ncbi:MAG TPA: hypothetical protein VFM18_22605, partial [Methanosarcina sp.]|nr:hypothetical protein [Methanosarcina sp.]
GNWTPGKSVVDNRMRRTNSTSTQGLSDQGMLGSLTNGFNAYFNPEGNSGVTYTPEWGSPVNLNNAQLDAIKNPTLGSEVPTGLAASSWGNYADMGLKGLGALGNIWQARTAAQGLDLAKEKFGFEKGLAAANYANQAKGYNEELARKANVGLALGGNAISPEQRTATLANVEANKVAPTLTV